jgi:hypothetical protein
VAIFFGIFYRLTQQEIPTRKIMSKITKPIKIQISGDADAVDAAIKILHRINFMNGSIWSRAMRKRGEPSIVKIAARSVEISDDD